jgi:hypothetical protein
MKRGWERDLEQAERLAADGHVENAATVLDRLTRDAEFGYEYAAKRRIDEVRERIRNGLNDDDRTRLDDQAASVGGADEPSTAVDMSPVGIALVVIGAVAMFIAIFLPYADESGFSRIQDNSLIQNGDGWFFLGLAITCGVAVFRANSLRRRTVAPIVLGLIGIGIAIYMGTSDSALQLCPVDSSFGGSCETASPGTGVYVAGVGALLMLIGGWHLWTSSVTVPTASEATTELDEKTCPDCAETIKAAAVVCRYCGHRFDEAPSEGAVAAPAARGELA